MRSGGREAIEDVLAAARPLADMLWARESEAGAFATPERRAALEARLSEVMNTIADETVRRYYRADFGARLRALFAPVEIATSARATSDERGPSSGAARRALARRAGGLWPRRRLRRGEPATARGSPLHRGHRTAIPRREALILQAALNHPWLLHDHLEELSETEFRHADTKKLKAALIDVLAHRASHDAEPAEAEEQAGTSAGSSGAELAAELTRRGFAEPARPDRALDHHALGLGRAAGGRPGRCFADLEAASCLASAMAFPN